MPSVPIPIDHTQSPSTPYPGMSSTSPSSTISISPQTPFYPPPALSNHLGSPPSDGVAGGLSPPRSGFFKWATASLGKSPPVDAQRGFDIPKANDVHGFKNGEDDHGEHHDSFEFGDLDDLKSRTWSKQRRAVSMSGPSGITSMLAGFGAASPPLTSPNLRDPTGNMPGSVPPNSVLAENAAKGQSVLRRLSMSGTSFRPAFLGPSTPSMNVHTAPNPPSIEVQPPISEPPPAEAPLQRAATITGAEGRGRRRYSDSGKKRGVSPMGERLLRDHGHF